MFHTLEYGNTPVDIDEASRKVAVRTYSSRHSLILCVCHATVLGTMAINRMSSENLTNLDGAPSYDRIVNELGTFIPWKYSNPKYRRKRMKPSVFWSLGVRYSRQEEPEYVKAWLYHKCKMLVQLWNESPSNA